MDNTNNENKKKVALVTGGDGGIGIKIVEALVKNNYKVALSSISLQNALKAKEKILSIYKDAEIEVLAPKIDNFIEVEKEYRRISSIFGPIEVLINNAGISDNTDFEKYNEEIYDSIFNTNIKGTFASSLAAIKIMEENNIKGVVINISSVAALSNQPKGVAYPSSKAAINNFTVSLAREVAKKGIRVNAISPGIIKTPLLEKVDPKMLEHVTKTIPLGYLGEGKDIANAVIYLISEEARYISGTILNVDGLVRF